MKKVPRGCIVLKAVKLLTRKRNLYIFFILCVDATTNTRQQWWCVSIPVSLAVSPPALISRSVREDFKCRLYVGGPHRLRFASYSTKSPGWMLLHNVKQHNINVT
jgi:hypothetical protein